VFIIGLQCGIEGAYFTRSVGAPAYAGVFAAWCDLRELVPYAFGYMMAAKVGTGIVAELGSMRISDEIDALEVMGIDSVLFLCATRLLAAWIVLPFMYMAAVGAGFFASYLAVVEQIGEVSSGGFFLIFWLFQNPPDFLYSLIKGMVMATGIVLVGCYYGYNASGGPVGRGDRHREVHGPEHRVRAPHRDARHPALLGREPARPHRRLTPMSSAPDPVPARPRVSVRSEPTPAARDEYQWHTGLNRPTGVPDAVEFIDVHKAFGRNQILRGLNMGIPDGKISMILGPVGDREVRLHQAHGRAAVSRRGRRHRPRRVRAEHARRRAVRDAQEVRGPLPGRRAVRLHEPLRQRLLPAAPAHGQGRGGDPGDRHPAPAGGRPGGRGGQVPQRAVGRHAQARGLRAALVLDPTSSSSTSRTRAWTPSAPRCCASSSRRSTRRTAAPTSSSPTTS
jgi:hypothetical protein